VILIGAIEITFMVALGYEVGLLLGWTATEAFFLGAALSISSSAIIVKMLRDTGQMFKPHGRLIIGILVVEDFAAVILLSILSAVGTSGAASIGDIGSLSGKLALFLLSSLVLGALFAPRLYNFVARLRSQETLLIVSLALCFGLALVADHLGISAAAGAFLIGTVLGDTDHSEDLVRTMSPVRDIFAALFFVSIGMLIDPALIARFIVPALVVASVFVVGKIVADTVGTFMTGHEGRTSLRVGMGMTQSGEFSLAMVKVGVDHAAIGPFLYPVVAVTTALTALVYPFVSASSDALASVLEKRSPRLLAQYVGTLSGWLVSMRTVFNLTGEVAQHVRHSGRVIVVNFGVVVVLLALGTFALAYTPELAAFVRLREGIIGLVISGVVIALCVPPAVFIWRAVQTMTDDLSGAILGRGLTTFRVWGRANLHSVLRDSILIVMVVLLLIWSLPFVSGLIQLGAFAAPIPVLLLAGAMALTWRTVFKIHGTLEATFRRTFLGEAERDAETGAGD
jgi:CPA2 family monovalent cation:H+ antiporter-2